MRQEKNTGQKSINKTPNWAAAACHPSGRPSSRRSRRRCPSSREDEQGDAQCAVLRCAACSVRCAMSGLRCLVCAGPAEDIQLFDPTMLASAFSLAIAFTTVSTPTRMLAHRARIRHLPASLHCPLLGWLASSVASALHSKPTPLR